MSGNFFKPGGSRKYSNTSEGRKKRKEKQECRRKEKKLNGNYLGKNPFWDDGW